MKKLIIVTTSLFLITGTLVLTGCGSSTPRYERMNTVEQYLDADDGQPPRNGMAITKKGAVLDITVEEVQLQKKRLEFELHAAKSKVNYLENENAELVQKNRELRLLLGLNPKEQQRKVLGYGQNGRPIMGDPVPSHADEVAEVRGNLKTDLPFENGRSAQATTVAEELPQEVKRSIASEQ